MAHGRVLLKHVWMTRILQQIDNNIYGKAMTCHRFPSVARVAKALDHQLVSVILPSTKICHKLHERK